jgi:dienelactone hydrolase
MTSGMNRLASLLRQFQAAFAWLTDEDLQRHLTSLLLWKGVTHNLGKDLMNQTHVFPNSPRLVRQGLTRAGARALTFGGWRWGRAGDEGVSGESMECVSTGMKGMSRFLLRLGAVFSCVVAFTGSLAGAADSRAEPIPRSLASHMQPPPEFAGQFGPYRSPLLFEDGTPVRTPDDWRKRRAEIIRRWHELLGPWPPLIDRPKMETLETLQRDGETITRRKVRVEIAPEATLDGLLLIPKGAGPFPAVLVLFYEPETSVGLSSKRLELAYGRMLARRGFVTLSIGSPGGDAWNPRPGVPTLQPLSHLAYVAANCHRALAAMPEVDPERIGVVGHSYGGKWAMFASCLYESFAAAVWSDPGIVFDETRPNVNYWEPWYLGGEVDAVRRPGVPVADNPRTGAYKRLVGSGRDLHELHALMAPRPFLVSGGSEDPPERWRALNHTVAVNALLGLEGRVAMTNRPSHNPTPEANAVVCDFFEHFLKATKSR